MIIKHKGNEPYINYTVNGTKVTFEEDITLNIEKYEKDDANHIDISFDESGCIVMGVSKYYAAEIDIPARQYTEVETEDGTTKEPVPFSMDNVTLTLWETAR